MKKVKKLLAILLVVAIVFGMIACGSKEAEKAPEAEAAPADTPVAEAPKDESATDLQVGIYFPTNKEVRWERDEAAIVKLMDEAGYSYSVLWGDGTPETERSIIESFVTQGAEVIVFAPCDTKASIAAAEFAHNAGAKIISYDRIMQDTMGIDYVVSFSSYDVGKAQAEYFMETAKAEGTKGNPLYMYSGNTTDGNAYDFFGGFWDTIQPMVEDGTFVLANNEVAEGYIGQTGLDRDTLYSMMTLIDTQWNSNVAKTLAETDLINATAELKGDVYILAPNDDTAIGIMSAFVNDAEISSYKIVGQDANEVNIQMIIDGEQAMTVWKDTTTLGAGAFSVVDAVIKGDDSVLPDTWNNGAQDVPATIVPVTAVTTANVKDTIFAAGYYDEANFDFSNWAQ